MISSKKEVLGKKDYISFLLVSSYLPLDTGLRTMIGGEFIWGGCLLKCNGGAHMVGLRRMEIDVDVYSQKPA